MTRSTRFATGSFFARLVMLSALVRLAFPAGAASASSHIRVARNATPAVTSIEYPMTIVDFDEKVAKANGYEIKVDKQGRKYSRKRGYANVIAAASDTYTGACGTSYIHYNALGFRKAKVTTGFGVIYPAVKYAWRVNVTGNIGVGSVGWGGLLRLRKTWKGAAVTAHGTFGYSWAQVNPAYSYAILANGGKCVAGTTWDDTVLY